MAKLPQTNFAHLEQHDEQLLRLGMLAEKYFAEDPNTCLLKLHQLSELLAQLVAAKTGQLVVPDETQYDLLRRLQDSGILPREIAQLFGEVRRTGNAASHTLEGDHGGALTALKITWQLSLWFHRTFKEPSFKSGPFMRFIKNRYRQLIKQHCRCLRECHTMLGDVCCVLAASK